MNNIVNHDNLIHNDCIDVTKSKKKKKQQRYFIGYSGVFHEIYEHCNSVVSYITLKIKF